MEDRWAKLEEIVRRVVREEIAQLGKKPKVDLVNGKWVGISESQNEAWIAAYGAVDIAQELRAAAAWCLANPSLSPKSNFPRFLNTWFSREQNRASLRAIPGGRPVVVPPSLCEYCGLPSVGAVGGRRHCRAHAQSAMDNESPPKFMPGVAPKAVAGRD